MKDIKYDHIRFMEYLRVSKVGGCYGYWSGGCQHGGWRSKGIIDDINYSEQIDSVNDDFQNVINDYIKDYDDNIINDAKWSSHVQEKRDNAFYELLNEEEFVIYGTGEFQQPKEKILSGQQHLPLLTCNNNDW